MGWLALFLLEATNAFGDIDVADFILVIVRREEGSKTVTIVSGTI